MGYTIYLGDTGDPVIYTYKQKAPDVTPLKFRVTIPQQEVGRTKEDAERFPFIWKTHSGREYHLCDMDVNHLFNTIRMLHNNTVPPAFRVLCPYTKDFKRYADINDWDSEYIETAFELMKAELEYRDHALTSDQRNQLRDIYYNRRYLKILT